MGTIVREHRIFAPADVHGPDGAGPRSGGASTRERILDLTMREVARHAARLADPAVLDALTTLSFSMHGLGVWRAGHVRPSTALSGESTASSAQADRIAELTIESAIARLLAERPS